MHKNIRHFCADNVLTYLLNFGLIIENTFQGPVNMMVKNTLKKVREYLREIVFSCKFIGEHRMKDTDFTRKRILGFPEIFTIIVKGAKRGIHTAIKEILDRVYTQEEYYSEMAFCKARRKINYTAFQECATLVAKAFYTEARSEKRWKEFRVWGIDGSKINLPTNPEILEEFGSENFKNGLRAQGLGSILYDTLNGITLDAELARHNANERELASGHLKKLKDFCDEAGTDSSLELITMDRGYPSEALIQQAIEYGISFVFRVNQKHFWKELLCLKDTDKDTIITHKGLTLRAVQVPLKEKEITKSGEVIKMATLLTNLPSDKYSTDDIAELYHLRWNIETNYGFLKNRVEIENFTGLSPLCVRQDFYVAILLSNLVACAFYDASDVAAEYSNGKKYDYKPNYTETYRELRRDLFDLMLSDSKYTFNRIYKKIQEEIYDTLIPIRKNRNPKRGKPHQGPRYFHNHKPS